MTLPPPPRLHRLLWLGALAFFVANALFPVSTRMTRAGGVGLFLIVWFGLIYLCWQWKGLRWSLLGLTAAAAIFLCLPARKRPDVETLRAEYVSGMKRYEGVAYYWGGESIRGIDCSGLIRRGLIDSLFLRGVRTGDAGLVRRALALWWRDCTASALGESQGGLTVRLLETKSINQLDHAPLLPGDLAVTRDGVHVLAYMGGGQWIEADPVLGKVVVATPPVKEILWFDTPVKLVRWSLLSP